MCLHFKGCRDERLSPGGRLSETAMVWPVRFDAVLLYAPHAAQSIGRRRSALHCGPLEVLVMYAVIRTGGKQYLVSPGEKLKIETTAHENGNLEFSDILAVSGEEGKFESDLTGAKVLASVVGAGRGDKILVFKLKRKKQYKKMQGHRQNFVEVKINEILVNGKSFKEEAK
jgi:large subunit ribosomal protein L21